MNALRKIALFLIGLLLFVTLPLHTFIWTTRQTLLDRNVILSWLKEGRFYDNVADSAAKLAEDSLTKKDENQPSGDQQGSGDGQMPDTATLIKAAKVALPPNVLQQNVEVVINSAYDWLEGKTDTIVINLDLSDEKKAFVDALGNEAITRAASLPTCTAQQVSDFDPLSSACIPSGTNVAAQAEKIKKELSTSKDFLPDTSITSADLTVGKDDAKKLISEEFKVAPRAFKAARNSAYIATAAITVMGVLVLLLGKTRRSGLKINAWLFGLAGLWAVFLGTAFRYGNSAVVNTVTKNSDKASIGGATFTTLATEVATSLFTWHIIIGGAYLGVAAFSFTAIKLMNNGKDSPKATEEPLDAPKSTSVQTPAEKPKAAAKPKPQPAKPAKKPTLVQ